MRKPLEYYHNNITGTLILCDEMRSHGVKNIVFSSSATCMEIRQKSPSPKTAPRGEITNPYGRTKGHAGADIDRFTYSGPGVECDAAALLQPHRCP